MVKDIIVYMEDDTEVTLPHKWVICGSCEGEGSSSAYLGVFTRDDIDEDPEFFEDYMAGHFDRACDHCGGSGKVKVVDRKAADKSLLAEYDRQQEEADECDRIHRQEMLMEGGWREEGWF